jgi:iron complex outermembrane receptor protein
MAWQMTPLAAAVLVAAGVTPAAAQLDEVIVTATRRAESVMDVPYNISAITAESLGNKRAFGLNDISRIVPGISYTDQGSVARGNNNNLVLRGINAQNTLNNAGIGVQNASAVSTYLGETPIFFNMTLRDV